MRQHSREGVRPQADASPPERSRAGTRGSGAHCGRSALWMCALARAGRVAYTASMPLTRDAIADHESWFRRYAAEQRALEHEDAKPLDLKLRHTFAVLASAEGMSAEEDMPDDARRATLLAALYHDLARFEQYRRYRTFRDRESRNHGQWAVRILKAERRLEGESRAVRHMTMAAVAMHNRFALPPRLPAAVERVAHVVRDADKLDILRIMDAHLRGPGACNPTVVLQLPDRAGMASETVLRAALAGQVPAYADLTCVNDFRVLLGAWFYDMHFAGSRRQFVEDGHARNIVAGLPDDSLFGPVRARLLDALAG